MIASAKQNVASKTSAKIEQIVLQTKDAFEFLEGVSDATVDLVVCSPPYFMGKEYDRSMDVGGFEADHKKILPMLSRVLKPGGSLCWQVGNHVSQGVVTPLDAIVFNIFSQDKSLLLRNRIVWTFGHGVHASKRFSGRHETILWFTKGRDYTFNLDAVRVPQKYPGKKHYKGPKKGDWSGNPFGKNPSDVWDIPNVKSKHVEKTKHPCQFPVALVQRCIRALTPGDGLVIDPFMGSGSTALACAIEGRRFAGCDSDQQYVAIARKRIKDFSKGGANYRPLERAIAQPSKSHAVAQLPPHFA